MGLTTGNHRFRGKSGQVRGKGNGIVLCLSMDVSLRICQGNRFFLGKGREKNHATALIVQPAWELEINGRSFLSCLPVCRFCRSVILQLCPPRRFAVLPVSPLSPFCFFVVLRFCLSAGLSFSWFQREFLLWSDLAGSAAWGFSRVCGFAALPRAPPHNTK